MNCDRIAPFYFALETAAFGTRLQKRRVAFLHAAAGKRHALILGDGDGRFLHALTQAYPQLDVDSVDNSGNMLAQARKRIGDKPAVRLIQADARNFSCPAAQYDIVFSHFFLDCFDTPELAGLIANTSEKLTARAAWIISDFRQAAGGWRRLYTRLWLGAMYRFFRIMTGLQTSRLPAHQSVLSHAGFICRAEQITIDGLIASEQWEREPR